MEDTRSDGSKGLTVFSDFLSPLSMPDQISLSLSFSFSPSLCLIIQRYMSLSLNHFLVFLFFIIRVSIKGKIDLPYPFFLDFGLP